MSGSVYYSDLHRVYEPKNGLVRDNIPERARHAVLNYLDEKKVPISSLWRFIIGELDWPLSRFHDPQCVGGHSRNSKELSKSTTKGTLIEWLDIMSAIYKFLAHPVSYGLPSANSFRDFVNERLLRHYSAFQMNEDGVMEDQGSAASAAVVAEARALLMDERLVGPDRQFQAAISHFTRRPSPDFEQSVASALNAVEGVVRIALQNDTIKLGDGIKTLMAKHGTPGSIGSAMSSLYGYASNEGGRHGLVGDPKVDQPMSEYCLHQSAAAIVFIARLEGWNVAEARTAA